jgi:hypothetical protein
MTTSRIIFQNETGGVSVIIPTGELPIEEVAAKDVPEGIPYEIVDVADIPSDRTFRGAWVMRDCCIEHDLGRCKDIAHDRRRAQREEEFAPFDAIIMKQIPGNSASEAEASRQEIRFKYALIQDAINMAETPDEIKSALEAA